MHGQQSIVLDCTAECLGSHMCVMAFSCAGKGGTGDGREEAGGGAGSS